ncbi:hypothetical protein FRC00_008582, partial [Tulasnella sp. 408]
MFLSVPFTLGRHFGDVQSVFAIIKLLAIAFLLIISIVLEVRANKENQGPSTYWSPPFSQYLDIPGAWGRFLGFWAVFMQAATAVVCVFPEVYFLWNGNSFRHSRRDSKRAERTTIIYLVTITVIGTVVPRSAVSSPLVDPPDPALPTAGAPWHRSPFLVALLRAGASYNWAANLTVALIMTSAASAASTETFLLTRYMHYLAKAGHAPRVFAKVWPNTERAKKEGVVVPWVGVLVVVGFSALSFMAMRPHQDLASDPEKIFSWISSMSSSAYLQ